MPASSSQMLLSVTFFRLQFKNCWHSSLAFMTSAQYYKAGVVQSCKTCSTNSEQLPLDTLMVFSRLWEGRMVFLRARWAPREWKSKGQFFPLTPILEAFLVPHYCRLCSVLKRPLLNQRTIYNLHTGKSTFP